MDLWGCENGLWKPAFQMALKDFRPPVHPCIPPRRNETVPCDRMPMQQGGLQHPGLGGRRRGASALLAHLHYFTGLFYRCVHICTQTNKTGCKDGSDMKSTWRSSRGPEFCSPHKGDTHTSVCHSFLKHQPTSFVTDSQAGLELDK